VKSRKSVTAALTAAFAALYAIGVVVLAPISFQVAQVRIADALLPLSILFGWPAILGLALGAFVANLFVGLGPIDVVGGSVANLVAGYVAWRVARNRGRRWVPLALALEILTVTFIVGTYLSYILAIPLEIGWLGVMLGSIIAIGLLGSFILYALSADRIAIALRGYRIPIYTWRNRAETERHQTQRMKRDLA
jgi:uncharacterized membrane protein